MELLQLTYFQTVAELEHITKAAEKLNITQPSLSKTISRLEEHVGIPLFDRKGRNIRLNKYGKVYLEYVLRVFRELENGEQEVRDMAGLHNGSIKLSVSITSIIPNLLESFLKLYPDVHFKQTMEPSTAVKRLLEEGDIDLSITEGPIEGPDLEWHTLRHEEIYVVVPNKHRLAGQNEVRMIDLKDESFIGLSSKNWLRNLMEDYCLQAGFSPKYAFEVDEAEVILLLLQQGMGICFVPALAWEKRSQFMPNRLRITDMKCQYTTGLAWSRKQYLSQAAKEFRQFVIDYYHS